MFVEQNFVTEAKNKELPIAGIQQMAVKFNIPDLEKKKKSPSLHSFNTTQFKNCSYTLCG